MNPWVKFLLNILFRVLGLILFLWAAKHLGFHWDTYANAPARTILFLVLACEGIGMVLTPRKVYEVDKEDLIR